MPPPRQLTFISYSHKNKVWLDKLLTILQPLVRKGAVVLWADTRIQAGSKWQPEIEKALASARVAVLLVSPDFLASDFIANHELPVLLRKAKAGGLTVLWVHVSSSLYQATELEEYQAAHDISKPLDLMTDPEQAKVLAEIAQKIWNASAGNKDGLESSIVTDQPREAIKGLRPFRHEDAEIFARLGRQVEIENYANAIADTDFRFGILSGESGCGKSSFIQAGLWPKLEAHRASYQCIYVKFANQDPPETIKRAMRDALGLQSSDLQDADLVALFTAATKSATKPLILFFDQFEQFFVHYKYKGDREPFVQALTYWYRHATDLPVKIVISIRGDFFDRLAELQKAMGYSIGSGQNFRLEKFEPEQAMDVVKVIAELEALLIEEQFVHAVISELAGREDGLISPAYLQIMCWVIKQQKTADKREFTRRALQKLGGVEGLLERFLADTLATRHSDSARQAAVKILLALIDLDRNTRAGLVTVAGLQEKIQETLSAEDVATTVGWLASSDLRLVTQHKQNDAVAYELAHECLIPAVRKVAGKQLSEMDRANQLLDRRVNEWVGNDRKPSYLLRWNEWRLVERNRPYLIWGVQRALKETFLHQTRRQWKVRFSIGLLILFAVQILFGFMLSPWGQIRQVKWDIAKLAKGQDQGALATITLGLLSIHESKQAIDVAIRIENPDTQERALAAVAKAMVHSAVTTKNPDLLKQAMNLADLIKQSHQKAGVLLAVVETLVQSAVTTKNPELLKHIAEASALIEKPTQKADALQMLAHATAMLGDSDKAAELLNQVAQMADRIEGPIRWKVAEAIAQLAVTTNNARWLKQAMEVASLIENLWARSRALGQIAETMAKAGDTTAAAELLGQAVEMAARIKDSDTKRLALEDVAGYIVKLKDTAKASALLDRAAQVTLQMDDAEQRSLTLWRIADITRKNPQLQRQTIAIAARTEKPWHKSRTLTLVAIMMMESGDTKAAAELLKRAIDQAALIENYQWKRDALEMLTGVATNLQNTTKASELLKQALETAGGIENQGWRGHAMEIIARSMVHLAVTTDRVELLRQAVDMSVQVKDPIGRAKALSAVAQTMAQSAATKRNPELLRQATEVAGMVEEARQKVEALLTITKAWAQVGDSVKAAELLKQAVEIAVRMDESDQKDWTLDEITGVMTQSAIETQKPDLMKEAMEVVGRFKHTNASLKIVAEATGKMEDIDKAVELLKQIGEIATRSHEQNDEVLQVVAKTMTQFAGTTQKAQLLKHAADLATRMNRAEPKAQVLEAVVRVTAELGRWREAYRYASRNTTDEGRARTLIGILQAWYGKDHEPTEIK